MGFKESLAPEGERPWASKNPSPRKGRGMRKLANEES